MSVSWNAAFTTPIRDGLHRCRWPRLRHAARLAALARSWWRDDEMHCCGRQSIINPITPTQLRLLMTLIPTFNPSGTSFNTRTHTKKLKFKGQSPNNRTDRRTLPVALPFLANAVRKRVLFSVGTFKPQIFARISWNSMGPTPTRTPTPTL